MQILESVDLTRYSIDECLSWGGSCRTTSQEDAVYYLSGFFFGVRMSFLLGEGRDKALTRFKRLTNGSPTNSRNIVNTSVHATEGHLYARLDESQFGFFILETGEQDIAITGHLDLFDRFPHPEFNAVSYVWGDEPSIHRIMINNRSVDVKTNLYHALRRMRDAEAYICL